ncbi:MAG: CBS domain-containing protein [bacterium]|jgi:acetoin utilization protein AcuB|nr:CBS domain-containing protein [Phycisphaerales bacterium]MCE2653326.1 CBS domain-containing protein [Planctomycetaceae bacterium]
MNVLDIMTPDAVTVGMDDSLETVRAIFNSHRFHHLLVIDQGRCVGVISDRDLLRNLSPFVGTKSERTQDAWSLQRKVHQIMTRAVVAVRVDTPIRDCMALLLRHGISCLPVLDDRHRPLGIVTWHDLLAYAMRCGIEPGCTVGHGPHGPGVSPAHPGASPPGVNLGDATALPGTPTPRPGNGPPESDGPRLRLVNG